jgi:uncharacterized MnhB-related membrane protein
MTPLIAALLLLLVATALGVVLTREPRRQVFAIAAQGLVLSALFLALQAPDVALSEIVIGTAALPLFFLVTLAALRTSGKQQ